MQINISVKVLVKHTEQRFIFRLCRHPSSVMCQCDMEAMRALHFPDVVDCFNRRRYVLVDTSLCTIRQNGDRNVVGSIDQSSAESSQLNVIRPKMRQTPSSLTCYGRNPNPTAPSLHLQSGLPRIDSQACALALG